MSQHVFFFLNSKQLQRTANQETPSPCVIPLVFTFTQFIPSHRLRQYLLGRPISPCRFLDSLRISPAVS